MKNIIFITASAAFMAFGFSSCAKCQVCSKPNSNEVRICEKDYDSNTAYGFTIDTYEGNGYNCKGSL